MKNLKKKLVSKIFNFMELEEAQYGSRELFLGDIIKELLVLLFFWLVGIYF